MWRVTFRSTPPPPHGGGAEILISLLLLTFDADFGRFLTRLIPHTRNKFFFSVYKENNFKKRGTEGKGDMLMFMSQ
jgi:hypothetical protein